MALDFYEIDDTRLTKKLFSLENNQLEIMDEIFVELKKLTGNYINPYATNRIYPDHIDLLLSLMKGRLNSNIGKNKKQNLLKIIEEFSKSKTGLLSIGD